eukprot:gene7908-9394_t
MQLVKVLLLWSLHLLRPAIAALHPSGSSELDACLSALGDPSLPPGCLAYVEYSAPSPGCFKERPSEPYRDSDGRQIVLVLEDNLWPSIGLVTELTRIVLEEHMGYKVVRLVNDSTSLTADRIAARLSHACVEYWSGLKKALYEPLETAGDIFLSDTGYMGRSGLYVSSFAFAQNASIYWDYYVTYLRDSMYRSLNIDEVLRYLPVHSGPPPPPRSFHVRDPITDELQLYDSHFCSGEQFCEHGQFYPSNCKVGAGNLTSCAEIYFMLPSYDKGFFETLLNTLGVALTAVYLGLENFATIIQEFYRQRTPIVFYHFQPNLLPQNVSRIAFPAQTERCKATYQNAKSLDPFQDVIDCDYLGEALQTVSATLWSPASGDGASSSGDPYYEWGLTFVRNLKVVMDQDTVDGLLHSWGDIGSPVMSEGNEFNMAVCRYLGENPKLKQKLLDFMPVQPSHASEASGFSWELLLTGLAVVFGTILVTYQLSLEISKRRTYQIMKNELFSVRSFLDRFCFPFLLLIGCAGVYFGVLYMNLGKHLEKELVRFITTLVVSVLIMTTYRLWTMTTTIIRSYADSKANARTLSASDASLINISIQISESFGKGVILIFWVYATSWVYGFSESTGAILPWQ